MKPRESRKLREPLLSQILTPRAERGSEEVEPEMNQRSSWIIALVKTRLVVRRGKEELRREKRSWGGAKRDRVPVPVLGGC